MMRNVNYSGNYGTIYTETKHQIGGGINSSEFSMADLLADTDAYNLYHSLDASSLTNTFSIYYNSGVSTRYTDFTNKMDRDGIFELTKEMMTNPVIGTVWPLKKVDSNGYKTSEDLPVSDNQMNAICNAFTDYIWDKVNAEKS